MLVILESYMRFFKNNFPKSKEGIFDETHCRWFTTYTLAGDLHKLGLTSIDLSYSGMEAGKRLYYANLITLVCFVDF